MTPRHEEPPQCDLCGDPSTHFCECEGCRIEPIKGRWMCDDCGLQEDEK